MAGDSCCDAAATSCTFWILGLAKGIAAGVVAHLVPCFQTADRLTLVRQPKQAEKRLVTRVPGPRAFFPQLSAQQQEDAYFWRWVIACQLGQSVDGSDFGRHHMWDDERLAAQAILRSGAARSIDAHWPDLSSVRTYRMFCGKRSRYFSLSDRTHRNPLTGWFGYVNGMGVSLEGAVSDARRMSDEYLDGNDVHCTYLPTAQTYGGEPLGFAKDVLRHLAVEGGIYTWTAVLLAQLWIDFLDSNPTLCFLQVAHSEGTTHTKSALRLLHKQCPHLLGRLRIVCLCGASLIRPSKMQRRAGFQAINILKFEDRLIMPWATGASRPTFCDVLA